VKQGLGRTRASPLILIREGLDTTVYLLYITIGAPLLLCPTSRRGWLPLEEPLLGAYESGLQADQHGAPVGDPYDGVACMVCSTLLKHRGGDPEKAALAKAGVKVAQPTEYSGSSNLEEFETFVAGILRWLGLYNLLGPMSEQTQIGYVGTRLKSEAQEWFYRNVERFDQEVKHWTLESVIVGL
jgi:hypothetical protein